MTREEAIKYGENKLTLLRALGYNNYYAPGEYIGYYDEFSFVTAALSALRPITREQVEKVWRGEWVDCSNGWMCSRCEYDNTYAKPFCPNCGAPMTDEAVDIFVKRMEEMRNG